MSKDFFWGLSVKDFQNSGWNTLHELPCLFAGFVAAVIANGVVHRLLRNSEEDKKTSSITTLVGIGAGVLATYSLANRLNHVTFPAEKALKFLVISLVLGATGKFFGNAGTLLGFICSGGIMGYFGRTPLYVIGSLGSVMGSLAMSLGRSSDKSK